ncbi:hypothetical protein [Mucilaginibacter sp.]|uniref:hypothetical protein n=1 Tax=Mucilaginibacter sp. TaxID=1882438 RepID=UPI0025DCAE2C|nr:hypothetical protein [Mucilaginibacter sp.]
MKFELDARKKYKQILSLFAFGLVIAVYGLNNSSPENACIGGGGIGASLMFYYQIAIQQTNKRRLLKDSFKRNEAKDFINLKFDDSSISLQTLETYIRTMWSRISGYRLYNECLFMLPGKEYKSAFVVKKNEVSEKEFEELIDFLAKRYEVLS